MKLEGKTYYEQNGTKILSDRYHIVLLPKGAVYEWICYEPGECIVIDFDADMSDNLIRSFEISDTSYFLDSFLKLSRLSDTHDPISKFESMQILYGLLAFLLKTEHKKYVPTDKRHLLKPAVDYMIDHYAQTTIQNEFLAGLCGMSTVYFRKTFVDVFGTPPIRYLHMLRIQKAKAILAGD